MFPRKWIATGFVAGSLACSGGAPSPQPTQSASAAFAIEEATIDGIHAAIRSGQTTCQAVVQAYVDRARAYNGVCTSLVTDDGADIPPATGTVRAVIPVGDERSRMVELRIALTDRALADRALRVGAPLRVEIAPQNLKPVVTVPRDAVILRQGASYVMRVRADNTAERVAVNLGPGRDNQVQIDGTLRAGEKASVTLSVPGETR